MLAIYSSIDIKYLYNIARKTTGDILRWKVINTIYGFTQAKILVVFLLAIFLLFVNDYYYLHAIARKTAGDILRWKVMGPIYDFTQSKILVVFLPANFLLFVIDYYYLAGYLLRVSEANEVTISSHVWVASMTFKKL